MQRWWWNGREERRLQEERLIAMHERVAYLEAAMDRLITALTEVIEKVDPEPEDHEPRGDPF